MTRSHMAVLLALVLAVPAAGAGAGFFSAKPRPCFFSGSTAYQLSGSAAANFTVRIENDAPRADLHMQLVNDPADADFVLVGDGDDASCHDARAVRSIRIDAEAEKPDLTVALSKHLAAGGYKIYVRSASFSAQEAAALFAVIWKSEHGREFLAQR